MADRSIFSKEERNFWILDVLIKHVATPAVRNRFNIIVPPNNLASVLNSNATTLQNLCSKKVINAQQQISLLRVPGVTLPTMPALPTSGKKAASSEDFDLTLMICLLRNLNLVPEPVTGWDQLPPNTDNSLGANLTRIKVYRNKLSHASKSRMNDNLFKKIWASLKTALSDVSDGKTDQMVHEIESFDFEGSNREQLLCKMQKHLHEIQNEMQFHRNMKENTTKVLEEWKSELEVFYKTKGTEEVLEKIRTNNIVMIIGNSGAGKSTTMKYVSLQLEDEGYEIIPVSSANDILFQRFSDRKQCFVIDDIFGKYRVDTVMFESWRRLEDHLKVIFRDKDTKLLCTLRRQVQNDMTQFLYETIFDRTVVDLDSSELALSEIEKKEMLNNHLLHRNMEMELDDISIQNICNCKYAFPLMCKLYSSNSDFLKRKTNFFNSPSEILKEEFDHFQKENNELYCVLVLIVIFDCEELKNIFDITCEIKRRDDYSLILQACGVCESISRTRLKNRLLSLYGVFVRLDNPFEFIHDNIEETVAFHFGNSFPNVMLRCCKSAFLRERIRIASHEMDDETVLIIKRPSYNALSGRFLKEISNGKFHDILLSEPLQNIDFVTHFVSFVENDKMPMNHLGSIRCTETLFPSYLQAGENFRDITNINREALIDVLQSSQRQFIFWVAATGSHLLFHQIFKKPKGVPQRLHEKYTMIDDLLHIAVLGGSIHIIRSLIKSGANVNSFDKYGIPLLCKVAGTKRCDIAELLMGEGSDMNQEDKVLGWTACHAASWFNDVGVLRLLLSRGCNLHLFDNKFQVPLVLAVKRNNEQAVAILLSYGAYVPEEGLVFDIPFTFNNLLEETLHNKNFKIFEMLLNSGTMVNSHRFSFQNIVVKMLEFFLKGLRTDNSKNPIWEDFVKVSYAIYKHDILMIHEILNKSETMKMNYLFRVIHVSDQVKVLANFNKNYVLFTPLHIAAVCDNVEAANVLMSYGANPYQRDIHGRTALHLANSKEMIEVLLFRRTTTRTNMSTHDKIQRIFASKYFPVMISSFLNTNVNIQNAVNIEDKAGNTPLHSIVISISNARKCLDAVDTLIQHGANPCTRCKQGFLPIDHFRTASQMLQKSDIDRGKEILECNKTKGYIRKEKWFVTSCAFVSVVFYLWFCLFVAKRACNQHPSEMPTDNPRLFQIRYMFYSQLTFVIMLPLIFLQRKMLMHSPYATMVNMPMRSVIYSEKLFLNFSRLVANTMVIIRLFYFSIAGVVGQTIFNLYCVCLCSSFVIIYFPLPIRRTSRKYTFLLLTVLKVILGWFPIWMLSLFFVNSSTDSNCINDVDNVLFLPFLYMKVFVFFIFKGLFESKIIRPLLHIVFQPVYLHKDTYYLIMNMFILIVCIIEILTVPVTMCICDIDIC